MAEIKLESGMSKLYELQTEFTRSLENIETLKKQYDTLNAIVEASGKKEELPENFVESLNEYKTNLTSQETILSNRLSYVKTLIGWYEKQDEAALVVDKIVTLTLEVLGIRGDSAPEEVKEEEKAE